MVAAPNGALQAFCEAKPWRRADSLRPSMLNTLGVKRPKGAKPKKDDMSKHVVFFGASSGIRTPDTLLKRQVLYRLS